MYCYTYINGQFQIRTVAANYKAKSGEVLFQNCASSDVQLAAAFPQYALDEGVKNFIATVKALLAQGDLTNKRICEAISLGSNSWNKKDIVDWVNYQRALRALLSVAIDPAKLPTIPTQPAYPAGT